MPQFFLNKKLILLLVSIIILVALIGFSLRERDRLSWPEQFIKDATGLAQQIFHTPVAYITGTIENFRDLQNTYDENKKLKARLDEYVKLKTEVQDLEKENKELREILDKKDSLHDFTPIQATVIGRNPDRWYYELVTINKGKIHGIEKNMAVITAKGLIGRVKYANQFTSSVQLLSAQDPKNRISAYIQGEKDIFGLIEGYDQKKQMLKLKRIPFNEKVKKGSHVLTSGLGGIFPAGLVIGTVEEVETDQYGLTQVAYLKPAADFYDIANVMVVDRKVKSAKSLLKEDETLESSEDENL
ncbi:rod shape-determining protein MreC [Peribacillus acanthi]|uniref:rod shape-determining protein MreC n=1 Tax=Peribacillus acanthi TaxID=2171554 RepID=UPI000D3E4067|nr:rod shape-determining protein MreC [Peribacillus acanthi]